MSKLEAVDYYVHEGIRAYVFTCPGCGRGHVFAVDEPGKEGSRRKRWVFDGDENAPSFTGVFRTRWHGADGTPQVCAFTVVKGVVTFAADSTHAEKNKAVGLKDWPPKGEKPR